MTFRQFKEWLAEIFFQFTPNQIKAIFVLTISVFAISYLTHDPDGLFYKEFHADSSFIKEYQAFVNQLEPKQDKPYLNRLDRYIIRRYDTIQLFPFDPNTANKATLIKLGFTNKQATTLLNYRRKGGHFYTKDDLRKLYGIRYMQYKILRPYIQLPDSLVNNYRHDYAYKQAEHAAHSPEQLFPFDPNTISKDSLQLLGFTERQANAIIKARKKGWHFRTKKDFAKLYVVSEEKFSQLEQYITLPDSMSYKKKHETKSTPAPSTPIELNTASEETLQKALDIKPWIAKRIINYRNALGGFYTKEQLKEVYGFPRSKYKQISHLINVDTTKIAKINIQSASFSELVHHPYIDSKLASWIIRRRRKGKLHSPADLAKDKELDPYERRILLHYLQF